MLVDFILQILEIKRTCDLFISFLEFCNIILVGFNLFFIFGIFAFQFLHFILNVFVFVGLMLLRLVLSLFNLFVDVLTEFLECFPEDIVFLDDHFLIQIGAVFAEVLLVLLAEGLVRLGLSLALDLAFILLFGKCAFVDVLLLLQRDLTGFEPI